MKKLCLALILFLFCPCFSLLAAAPDPQAPSPPPAVKIGFIAPLTGPFADWGESIRRGVEIALQDTTIKFTVDYQDDSCRALQALSIANKFFRVGGIQYVLGPGCDDSLKAIAPIAARANAVLFSTGLLGDDVFPAHHNVINLATQISGEAKRLMRQIAAQGIKTLAIVYATNSFGEEYGARLREAAQAKGITTISESNDLDTTDFHALLVRVLKRRPDGIFIDQSQAGTLAFMRQLRALRAELPAFGYYSIEGEWAIKSGSAALNGITYAYPINSAESSAQKRAFDQRFAALFGANAIPSATSYYVYDGLMILDRALPACAPADAWCVQSFFKKLGVYHGISGDMTFRADGANIRPYGIKRLVDGKFVWISREP